ncbi:MAG: hypothetical protein PVJ07_08130 [Anaerolineales bacterium]|jgi:hypothetical protein
MAKTSEEMYKKARHWLPEETRQHLEAARAAMRESVKSLFPPEFAEQRKKARREALLAARSLIDRALERLETEEGA